MQSASAHGASSLVCVWILSSGLVSFLVSLDGAICVVGECEFLQCAVLGKHGAVSDDVTLRGRDVIFFFLKQAKIISRCRYVPGMPRPGVSK